jgi:mannonate dehydratase
MAEIAARPNDYDRVFTEEEVWDNFAYFLAGVSPVMKECGVRMALHPNDPPVPSLCGVGSLIWNMDGYRRAIALDRDGVVGVKMCIGCWLEGGDRFGDVLSDIRELQAGNRIVCVHFRNVSSTLPDFEETLCEDGYADMYAIMKELVRSGYEGTISIDHAFAGYPEMGGMVGSFAYPTGYMKGLLHAAEAELGKGNP